MEKIVQVLEEKAFLLWEIREGFLEEVVYDLKSLGRWPDFLPLAKGHS